MCPKLKTFIPPHQKIGFKLIEGRSQNKLDDFSQLELAEKQDIIGALKEFDYNKSKTKDHLKITINTLNSKIAKYKIGVS